MPAIRRILFAVRDPDAARQPGVVKAIRIARSFGASLELFHALSAPVYLPSGPVPAGTIEGMRAGARDHARARLEKFIATARNLGVELECTVDWDYPPHEAIVRRAATTGADLIVAECHKGVRTRPWLIHLTDWELLRTSPLPVLLLRNSRPYHRPLTLAAVDPGHAHAKPADLDAHIVDAATQFSQVLRGALHLVHANHPPVMALMAGDPGMSAASVAATFEDLTQQEREAFEKLVASTGVPRARSHFVDGHPAAAIPRAARKLRAGLVVMGAVSRSGLRRVFIGNTAERVLNDLRCDVLVVKSGAFESRVDEKSRGMRVVAPAPTPLVS